MRIRDVADNIPKPMIPVGGPILWHIMKYYAWWRHNEFVLCLGHKGHAIKEFFFSPEIIRQQPAPGEIEVQGDVVSEIDATLRMREVAFGRSRQ